MARMLPREIEGLAEPDDMIDCGHLYKAMGGDDCHGGRYDSAQRILSQNGWSYSIAYDVWFAPHVPRH